MSATPQHQKSPHKVPIGGELATPKKGSGKGSRSNSITSTGHSKGGGSSKGSSRHSTPPPTEVAAAAAAAAGRFTPEDKEAGMFHFDVPSAREDTDVYVDVQSSAADGASTSAPPHAAESGVASDPATRAASGSGEELTRTAPGGDTSRHKSPGAVPTEDGEESPEVSGLDPGCHDATSSSRSAQSVSPTFSSGNNGSQGGGGRGATTQQEHPRPMRGMTRPPKTTVSTPIPLSSARLQAASSSGGEADATTTGSTESTQPTPSGASGKPGSGKPSVPGAGASSMGAPKHYAFHDMPYAAETEVQQAIMRRLYPTKAEIEYRKRIISSVFEHIVWVLRRLDVKCDLKCYIFGSVNLRTFLPDGDNDITILFQDGTDTFDPKAQAYHADFLSRIREQLQQSIQVDDLVFAEVRVLKLIAQGYSLDVTVDQLGGLSTVGFLQEVDATVGNNHLFKKSLLFVKAWCFYEARILGAQGGGLGTYAVTVMLIAAMNELMKAKVAMPGPLGVFLYFLQYYSVFDFSTFAVTVHGPVALETLRSPDYLNLGSTTNSNTNSATTGSPATASGSPATLAEAKSERSVASNTNSESNHTEKDSSSAWTSGSGPIRAAAGAPGNPSHQGGGGGPRVITEEFIDRVIKKHVVGISTRNTQDPNNVINERAGAESPSGSSPNHRSSSPSPTGFQSPTGQHNQFPLRSLNVVDPIRPYSNLCRGVSAANSFRIQEAIREGFSTIVARNSAITEGNAQSIVEDFFGNIMAAVQHIHPDNDDYGKSDLGCTTCLSSGGPFCCDFDSIQQPFLVAQMQEMQHSPSSYYTTPDGRSGPTTPTPQSTSGYQFPYHPQRGHPGGQGGGGGGGTPYRHPGSRNASPIPQGAEGYQQYGNSTQQGHPNAPPYPSYGAGGFASHTTPSSGGGGATGIASRSSSQQSPFPSTSGSGGGAGFANHMNARQREPNLMGEPSQQLEGHAAAWRGHEWRETNDQDAQHPQHHQHQQQQWPTPQHPPPAHGRPPSVGVDQGQGSTHNEEREGHFPSLENERTASSDHGSTGTSGFVTHHNAPPGQAGGGGAASLTPAEKLTANVGKVSGRRGSASDDNAAGGGGDGAFASHSSAYNRTAQPQQQPEQAAGGSKKNRGGKNPTKLAKTDSQQQQNQQQKNQEDWTKKRGSANVDRDALFGTSHHTRQEHVDPMAGYPMPAPAAHHQPNLKPSYGPGSQPPQEVRRPGGRDTGISPENNSGGKEGKEKGDGGRRDRRGEKKEKVATPPPQPKPAIKGTQDYKNYFPALGEDPPSSEGPASSASAPAPTPTKTNNVKGGGADSSTPSSLGTSAVNSHPTSAEPSPHRQRGGGGGGTTPGSSSSNQPAAQPPASHFVPSPNSDSASSPPHSESQKTPTDSLNSTTGSPPQQPPQQLRQMTKPTPTSGSATQQGDKKPPPSGMPTLSDTTTKLPTRIPGGPTTARKVGVTPTTKVVNSPAPTFSRSSEGGGDGSGSFAPLSTSDAMTLSSARSNLLRDSSGGGEMLGESPEASNDDVMSATSGTSAGGGAKKKYQPPHRRSMGEGGGSERSSPPLLHVQAQHHSRHSSSDSLAILFSSQSQAANDQQVHPNISPQIPSRYQQQQQQQQQSGNSGGGNLDPYPYPQLDGTGMHPQHVRPKHPMRIPNVTSAGSSTTTSPPPGMVSLGGGGGGGNGSNQGTPAMGSVRRPGGPTVQQIQQQHRWAESNLLPPPLAHHTGSSSPTASGNNGGGNNSGGNNNHGGVTLAEGPKIPLSLHGGHHHSGGGGGGGGSVSQQYEQYQQQYQHTSRTSGSGGHHSAPPESRHQDSPHHHLSQQQHSGHHQQHNPQTDQQQHDHQHQHQHQQPPQNQQQPQGGGMPYQQEHAQLQHQHMVQQQPQHHHGAPEEDFWDNTAPRH